MIKVKIKKIDNLTQAWFKLKKELKQEEISILELYLKKLNKDLIGWRKAIKLKTKTPIPKKYLHKRRPYNRKWTYRVTGEQYRAIKIKLIKELKYKGHITIKAWAEIGVPYSIYTDLGKPARKDGKIPYWKDWVYDSLFKKGRDGIMSVNDIFDNFIFGLEKELL